MKGARLGTGTGALAVRVENPSVFLSHALPFEVRDAWHQPVVAATGGWSGELPVGLYSVVYLSARGERHTEVAAVRPGEETTVVLGATESVPPGPPDLPGTRGITGPTRGGPVASVLATSGCTAEQEPDGGWFFVPESSLEAVPTATLGVDDRRWEVSLPLNPQSQERDLAGCRVDVVPGPQVQVSIPGARRVTGLVEGLRRTRDAGLASDVLHEATELLLWKYQDPPGATLGGLTLERVGALASRRDWVENLARSFPWIPDAQILLASLQAEGPPDERAHGLHLLLEAARRRPMFTDALALALRLLRHWPDGDDGAEAERGAALEDLADIAAWTDWGAVSLTTEVTGGTP